MVKKVPTSLVESCLHLKMKSELERLERLQMLRTVKQAYILGVKYCSCWKAQWKIEDLHRFCPPESGTESVTLPITWPRMFYFS